jgi:hypothetical protein
MLSLYTCKTFAQVHNAYSYFYFLTLHTHTAVLVCRYLRLLCSDSLVGPSGSSVFNEAMHAVGSGGASASGAAAAAVPSHEFDLGSMPGISFDDLARLFGVDSTAGLNEDEPIYID